MLGIWALLLAVAAGGLIRVQIETPARAFSTSRPRSGSSTAQPGAVRQRRVLVAGDRQRGAYDAAALRLIADASRALEALPGVRRVDSLSTLPIIEVVDGEIRLEPALDPDVDPDAAARMEIARRVEGDRIAARSVVSDDGPRPRDQHLARVGHRGSLRRADRADPRDDRGAGRLGLRRAVFRTETNLRTQYELGIFVPMTIVVSV